MVGSQSRLIHDEKSEADASFLQTTTSEGSISHFSSHLPETSDDMDEGYRNTRVTLDILLLGRGV